MRSLLCLILVVVLQQQLAADPITIEWTNPVENVDGTPLTDLSGIRIHWGSLSRQYINELDVSPTPTSRTFDPGCGAWYFSLTAVNSLGERSAYSNEALKDGGDCDPPPPPRAPGPATLIADFSYAPLPPEPDPDPDMPTPVYRYINPASSGGDGTTSSTSGATAAFAGFGTASSALASRDLVANDEQLIIRIGGSGNVGQLQNFHFDSVVMDQTRNIRFEALNPETTAGPTLDLGTKPYIDGVGSGSTGTKYLEFHGLQIVKNNAALIRAFAPEFMGFYKCHLGATALTVNQTRYIDLQAGSSNFYEFINNYITVASATGNAPVHLIRAFSHNLIFYNNTLVGPASTALMEINGSNNYVKNNIFELTGGGGSAMAGTNTYAESASNITSDATSPQTALRNITLDFESATDFSLAATDTDAIDAGTDLSADAQYSFSDDQAGTTRATWDIGANEYESAGVTVGAVDVNQDQVLDTVTIQQTHSLDPADVDQLQLLEAPTVSTTITLDPGDVDQDQVVATTTMQQDHQLDPGAVDQDQVLEAPDVVPTGSVSPGDLVQLQEIELPTIVVTGTVSPEEVAQLQLLDAIVVSQDHQLSIVSVDQLQETDAVQIDVDGTLRPADVVQIQEMGAIVLQQDHQLSPVFVNQIQAIGGPSAIIPSDFIPRGRAVIVAKRDRVVAIVKRLRAINLNR